MRMIKICSWNVNGLRTFANSVKPTLDQLNADIICFQETKTNRNITPALCEADGFNAYFSHCTKKQGYSGVCVFCRNPVRPFCVFDNFNELSAHLPIGSFNDPTFYDEGRFLALQFRLSKAVQMPILTVICVYCPRVDPEKQDRVEYRRMFLNQLGDCINRLMDSRSYVILAGDLNICHREIDHCNPEEYRRLDPEPRMWLDNILGQGNKLSKMQGNEGDASLPNHMVDLFRLAHRSRENAFSCWCSRTGARKTNYGSRIDYVLCDKDLAALYDSTSGTCISDLMVDIQGSDHCPVWASLPLTLDDLEKTINQEPLPPKCTAFWPQCRRAQKPISHFFQPTDSPHCLSSTQIPLNVKRPPPAATVINSKSQLKQKQLKLVSDKPEFVKTPSNALLRHDAASSNYLQISKDAEKRNTLAKEAWNQLLRAPEKPPNCVGHGEACVHRTVKRLDSPNFGRSFWTCARPEGAVGNSKARCSTFIWVKKK